MQLGLPTHRPPLHREYRHKSNITFNDNDTVSFLEYRNFKFQPDKSSGSESDYIVMPNILVLVRLPVAVPPPCPHVSPSPSTSPCPGQSLRAAGGSQGHIFSPASVPGTSTGLWFRGAGQRHCLSLSS